MRRYKEYVIINERPRWVIVDENRNIIIKNPNKEELKGVQSKKSYTRPYIRHTDEELLDYLTQYYEKNRRVPTARDFDNNHEYPSSVTYQNRFDNWNNAIELSGLNINIHTKHTDEELLNCLKRFYEETRRAPNESDFVNNPMYPGTTTYVRHFGNWSAALKLVGLDIESTVKNGIIETNDQKARFSEMIVRDNFKKNPIDLAGDNKLSHCDGICPNGKTYDVKSSSIRENKWWMFGTKNKYREEIEIYYLLAFNEDYTELKYAWRVPGEMVEKDFFKVIVYNSSRAKFCIGNMKEYDITEKLRDVLKEYKR